MTAPRTLPKPEISEQAFTDQLLDLAVAVHWRRIHLRPARTAHGWRTPVAGDGEGFPDLLLIRGPRLVVAELKIGRRKPTAYQLDWLQAFRNVPGCEAYLWRPDDWDQIVSVLR